MSWVSADYFMVRVSFFNPTTQSILNQNLSHNCARNMSWTFKTTSTPRCFTRITIQSKALLDLGSFLSLIMTFQFRIMCLEHAMKVQIKHAVLMILNNELRGPMMPQPVNIWYPLKEKEVPHFSMEKSLEYLFRKISLCFLFFVCLFLSLVHSLRRLCKLNCLQILKTTNKMSVREEI